ncbi:hypothetical protein M0804_011919 [Polistes exclamans]|nr:hypothetical protein M0804_011919 [Polistes exclamans]
MSFVRSSASESSNLGMVSGLRSATLGFAQMNFELVLMDELDLSSRADLDELPEMGTMCMGSTQHQLRTFIVQCCLPQQLPRYFGSRPRKQLSSHTQLTYSNTTQFCPQHTPSLD